MAQEGTVSVANEYILPRRIGLYLRRLAAEYEATNKENLARVITRARVRVIEKTSYDNWDGGIWGHELVLYLEPADLGLVPLGKQDEIGRQITEDLNRASTSVSNETIDTVHFELLDENDRDAQSATTTHFVSTTEVDAASIWAANRIRLFISHRDTHKNLAHALTEELNRFGISSFVAHDTIEPDEVWLKEIEKALSSMEVMVAVITDDFFESVWTNQEIGFAVGRGVPVISIKFGSMAPRGFIEDRQAHRGHSENLRECADAIFRSIVKRMGQGRRVREVAIGVFSESSSFIWAETNFSLIDAFDSNLQTTSSGCGQR